jgi:hypothetical protein
MAKAKQLTAKIKQLSEPELNLIRETIKQNGDCAVINDMHIVPNYEEKNVAIYNLHTGIEFDLNCRDRRLIFKYFQP